MSCKIIERKVDDGQLVGYLLEQEGLTYVVELRDLYEQEILDGLIESGYEYHDYYGDITTADGISINELASSPVTPEDNLSFKGELAKDALTEQQALSYFRTNMKDVIQVEFLKPVKLLINTREELVSYLKRWKNVSSNRVTDLELYPINAICAKEALFMPEEIVLDNEVRDLFIYMSNRRRYPTLESLKNVTKFFIENGVMEKEDSDNVDAYIKAYSAWGPEGINAPCINQRFEQDVIYAIGAPYTGSGREKLTFNSIQASLHADVKDDILSQINYRLAYGIMDKEGYVHSGDQKVDRGDIIENTGDVLLSQEMMKKYNALSRSTGKWETPYRALQVINVIHLNRMSLTLQTPEGRMYEWRMDKSNIALVSTNSSVFVQPTGTVATIEGGMVRLDRLYEKDGYMKYTMFHRIAEEIIDTKRTAPVFKSTSEMCLYNGLHAEQALDYIQFMSNKAEASSILHGGLSSDFMRKFGAGIEDLDENSDFMDVLDLLSTNYNDAINAEGEAKFDYSEVLANIMDNSIPQEDKRLAMYINNERPDSKINAILDFTSEKVALEQAKGRSFDNGNSNEEQVYFGLMTMYHIINGDNISQSTVGDFVEKMLNEEYITINDMVLKLNSEAIGCQMDYATLKSKQTREVASSIWVTSAIGEYSAAPLQDRRHIGFAGLKMNLAKNSYMRKLVDALIVSVDEQMVKSGLYSETDRNSYARVMHCHVLDFLWGIKIGNVNLTQENGMYFKKYVEKTKYTMSVEVTLKIGESDFHHIKNPNCPDFTPVFSTLTTYCKNSTFSVVSSFRFDSMLMNVNINPWKVLRKAGFDDILVYNGCLNLINNNQWETHFKVNLPSVYNEVTAVGGRMAINPYDYDNTFAIYPTPDVEATIVNMLFGSVNKTNGRTGNNLPIEVTNYLLDDNEKEESFRRYMQRVNNTMELINKNNPGKKMYRVPTKSDIYYKAIAGYYNQNIASSYEVEDMSYPGVASKPYQPCLTEQFLNSLIGTTKDCIQVTNINNYRLSVEKLLGCSNLVRNGFSPVFNCYVGGGNIFLLDRDRSVISLSDTTLAEFDTLARSGVCYRLSTREFMFYGVNGTFIVEV